MISATIQGINRADNYEHTTAQNGKLITGDEQTKCANEILRDCKNVMVSGEIYSELENGKLFCALYHPIKDDIGRRRIALIVWDKDTPNELIQKTLEVMGLKYERFLELKSEFEARFVAVDKSGGKNIWIAIGGVALVAFVAYLIFKQ